MGIPRIAGKIKWNEENGDSKGKIFDPRKILAPLDDVPVYEQGNDDCGKLQNGDGFGKWFSPQKCNEKEKSKKG